MVWHRTDATLVAYSNMQNTEPEVAPSDTSVISVWDEKPL